MEQQIKAVMARVFGVPVTEIPDDASPHELAAWDSLKHMNLVVALEDEFGIRFDDEEIPVLTSLSAIAAMIAGHKG